MKKSTLIAALIVFGSAAAHAADCTITISRKACAGKETEAMKPYNGKNPTEETKKLDSEEACLKWGEKSSKIIRKGTLTEKSVTVKFDGKDLGKTFADKAECK